MRTTHALMAMLAIIIMAGCSSTLNFVSVEADSGSLILGTDMSTPITQDASGEGAFATEGAASSLGKAKDLVGKFLPDLSQKTTTTPTTPPLQPVQPVAPAVPVTPPAVIKEELDFPDPATPVTPVGPVVPQGKILEED